MNRQNVIIVTYPNEDKPSECYGNLKKACKAHGLVYNTMVQKKMPIILKDIKIERVKFS